MSLVRQPRGTDQVTLSLAIVNDKVIIQSN